MKTNYKFIVAAILMSMLCLGFIRLSNSEDPFITGLKNYIELFYKNKQWEKVYLHVDKSLYKPGEDIWFKAYVTDGATNMPSNKSDVVYIELIDPKGNVDKSLTLQVIQGMCFGNFTIDETCNGGIYKIKAYTHWMKNFGLDYFFEKEIQVQKVVYPRLLAKIDFKRESYSPGDTVKAELKIETLENIPLSFTGVNVDFSLAGSVIKSTEEQTDNKGKVMLQFVLPETLKTNDGLVNAKIMHDGNIEAISRSIPIVLNKINIDFFPEGGYMVANIPSTIAFKAMNEFGKPAEVDGYITDDSNNTILEFSSFHQGMGAFELTPVPGKRYFAVITKPNTGKKYELPEVMPKGYSLKIISTENNKYKAIYYTPGNEKVHLAIQAGNTICFSKSETAKSGKNEIEFKADDFPTGTSIITLFDRNGTPRCERLVFCNYHKQLNISLKFDKEKYSPREKVSLRIRTTDRDSIPVAANLSLAVVNDQLYTMADDKQHNMLSWMLLGSEIKGKIEKPNFYFDPEEPKAEKAIDYLLLTQGWRRYNWDDLLKMNYNVLFPAERIGCISGIVKEKSTGMPLKAEVTVIELQNRKRILKVNTGANGRFRFENADASSYIQVLARTNELTPDKIFIEIDNLNELSGMCNSDEKIKERIIPEIIRIKAGNVKNEQALIAVPEEIIFNGEGLEMELQEDVKSLEEVVVVGYGVQKKSEVTGSIVTVNPQSNLKNVPISIQQALQGKASGITVINNSGQPGSASQIRIRGTASVNNNEPLYVVDGVVYDPSLSGNSSVLQNIPISNIESISVLKDASATSIYGSRAANGVIIINTTSNYGFFKKIKKDFDPKYTGLMITPRKLSTTKEFYYPVYKENVVPDVREDFRPTIYWNPNISTNSAGEATVEFYASDEITTFRAITEGIGISGDVGRHENKFASQLPFSMAVKFPAYLSFGDTVIMPLIVKNNTSEAIQGKFKFTIPASVNSIENLPDSLEIKANSTLSINIPFLVKSKAGKDKIQVNFLGGAYKDAFIQEIDVQPKGFPTYFSVSGKEKEKSFTFTINKPVNGSLRASFSAFPDILSDLMSGIESILQEPYGCFEQTSSSTYPNIMVISYLNAIGTENRQISDKALGYIKTGYKRLISFETSENGYEWFGHTPAHLGLTAYGLMEFTDMKKVYDGVDDKMIKRTLKWILSKRDGNGRFKSANGGYHEIGTASNEVTNAYVVYALSEVENNEVEKEYKRAFEEAIKSQDPYRISLMANAAYNYKNSGDGNKLMEILHNKLLKEDWDKMKIDHSITKSYGKSLQVETAALYTLALMKSQKSNWSELEKSVSFLIKSRSNGGFGSTQATILALKALTEYSKLSAKISGDGEIEIIINGDKAINIQYKKGDKGKITLTGLEKYLKEGENEVAVKFKNSESALPYTFDAYWNSSTPASDKNCQLYLKTSLSVQNTKVGETVRLNAKLQNISNTGLPMTMAIIGIPSGLSLQPWQLKEMQEKEQVDFYELSKNYLVVYYRQMAPGELREIILDLRAEIAGSYQSPASCTYLYYTNEFKHWIDGESIKIENSR